MGKWFTILKWSVLCCFIALMAGATSAFFLITLDYFTHIRVQSNWLLACLPIGGWLTIWLYKQFDDNAIKGLQLISKSIQDPKSPIIPILMAPLIYITTIIAHVFGASTGREGTALQISTALADQLSQPFKLSPTQRAIVLRMAIAAGFGAVFGTPLAGTVFALEFMYTKQQPAFQIVPILLTALVADQITLVLGAVHSNYRISFYPDLQFNNWMYLLLASLAFGFAAFLFKYGMGSFKKRCLQIIPNPYWRIIIGGTLIAIIVFVTNAFKYIGLGVPSILEAFETTAAPIDFIFKLCLTILTLSVGFKGGEATPLFFIGATLGSALSLYCPLPTGFLAGMGLVAVFGAAAKTPLASALMAYELFGKEALIYAFVVCIIASFISGKRSIYREL